MKQNWFFSLMMFFLLVGSSISLASNEAWLEKSIEVQVDEKNPNTAQRLLLEQATERVSLDIIKETIGPAKYARNQILIQNKVLKSSARFVPLAKPGDLMPLEKGYKMTVLLKINPEELQQVLLENGLFYESDIAPMILPAITVRDQIDGSSYSWWQEAQSPLSKVSRDLEVKLRGAFWKSGFYVMRPQGYRFQELLGSEAFDKRQSAMDWNAQIYVDGLVQVERNPQHAEIQQVTFHLTAMQTKNNRSIAEVTRRFDVRQGQAATVKIHEVLDSVCQDLATQVLETWQKGALGSNSLWMTFEGKIPLRNRELLKQELHSHAREIKSVRERKISAGSMTLDVESSFSPRELGAKIPKVKVADLEFVFKSSDDKSVFYELVDSAKGSKANGK